MMTLAIPWYYIDFRLNNFSIHISHEQVFLHSHFEPQVDSALFWHLQDKKLHHLEANSKLFITFIRTIQTIFSIIEL